MPFKPNYRMQRADRERAKEQKKQAKLLRRAEKAAKQETVVTETPDIHVLEGNEKGSGS